MDALTGLIVYGPLGIWALAATLGLISLYRDVSSIRDVQAQAIEELGTSHAQALKEQADRYDRQIAELNQRTLTIISTITDKMSQLAETLTRKI